jgi:hypothetical protein
MAIKQITATNPFQDPQAVVVSNGSLTLDLSQPAMVSGSGEIVPTRVTILLDTTGKIANQPVNLWANDQLTPVGTTYRLRVYNSNGLLVSDIGQVSIVGASPIDISALTPISVGVSFPSVVLLNPSGDQLITGGFVLQNAIFRSASSNPSTTGFLRMNADDRITWRNQQNNANFTLGRVSPGGNLPDDTLEFQGATGPEPIWGFPLIASSAVASGAPVTGSVRLSDTDTIVWRNHVNSGDVTMQKNNSDLLLFGGLFVALTIAAGTVTMPTSSINGGAVSASATGTVTRGAAANLMTSDVVTFSFSSGLPAANPAELTITCTVASNGVAPTFQYCNETGAPITPNAATLNWIVVR